MLITLPVTYINEAVETTFATRNSKNHVENNSVSVFRYFYSK